MNIVFGSISTDSQTSSQRIKLFKKYVDGHHQVPVKTLPTKNSKVQIAYASNKGKLIGYAIKDDVLLLLNGFIYLPLPGWKSSLSSLDDPNETAKFLLEKYLEKGDRFIENSYGHYSVIVYDQKKDKTLLLRDPDGQNDLFIYKKDNELIFSNQIRPIVESLGDEARLDRSYEDFFLIYGFYPYGKTMYENLSLTPKNRALVYQKNKISEKSLAHSSKGSILHVSNEQTLIEQLHKSLSNSLKNILPTQEKKAAVLLGGFDSALVASMLVDLGIEVETFSFYYEDKEFNQKHTDTVAKHLGIKHNWIKVDENVFQEYLEKYSQVFNYPTNWPCYLMQTAYLCKVIKERGFNYCYTGDGCDALFYGYPLTFKRAEIMSKIGALPNPLLTGITKVIERPLLERTIGRPHQVIVGAMRSAKRKDSERTFLTFRIFNEMSLRQLRKGKRPRQSEKLELTVSNLVKDYVGMSPIRMAYEGKNKVAPSRNKINGSADLSGLVIMSPYTHHEVKAFVKKIPDRLLRPGDSNADIGKYILSKMAEEKNLLPKEVIYQPKMAAADAPLQKWYNTKLQKKVYSYLNELPFAWKTAYIKSLVRETSFEKVYARIMSKDTNKFITMDHCISLLLTYSRFTKIKK